MSSNINPLVPQFGNATTSGLRANFVAAKSEIEEIQSAFGFANYEDTETAITPIALSSNVWTNLTNNTLGPRTVNKLPSDISTLWNPLSDKFDFSDLPLYTQMLGRFDITVTTSSNNQDIDIRSLLGIGSASEYTFPLMTQVRFPTDGMHHLNIFNGMFIGSEDIKNSPASIQIKCSGSASVVVAGWYLSIIKPTL
jgi:hypothetical protein